MVLVTCAAGGVASRLIPELVKAGLDVRAFDISPKVHDLKAIGVKETMQGDGSNAADVAKAVDGCEQVLYIPPMFLYIEAEMANLCVDEAVKAGVKQFVMTTVTHPNMSTLPQHTQKLHAEEHLIYKGLSDGLNYTILQPMHYCHNFSVPQVWEIGAYNIFYTKTTRLSYVDAGDVGIVAAKILTEDGHQNATYELVGSDFLSPVDMVGIFNDITGRSAVCNQISVDDILEYFGNGKYDSYFVKTFRCLSDTYGKYGIAGNPNVLTWLLGRKPTTFAEYIKNEIEANGLM